MERQSSIERFVKAQEIMYPIALQEMRDGGKRSHWIWYIFPQIQGLGMSNNARYYGIRDIKEAEEYLHHPILGKRIREITLVLLEHSTDDILCLMGSRIDAVKLRSSMTLFDAISPDDIFSEVLDVFFNGNRDKLTLDVL